ncbi:glutamate--cysteine ligase regulatory subunit-like [Physella acuta]|uniref:glutamate--cysteine ligase regulatory subunit-like n=1 Tax=Physella acuta TaxID=109671 RepID=UPI0027DC6142|nr:glutamate--cysteine ligase regulatory subunit-like [Physella acuta]XP_059175913.1 glutamate--cysteine ligase regulatory subunit-like [Physella acuta]
MSTRNKLKVEQELSGIQHYSSISTATSTFSRMSSDRIPLFPKAKSLFVHSGNIINWNRLKRKPNQNSTEEICDCISNTLGEYLESADKTQLQYVKELYTKNSENIKVLEQDEREDVKITVKVFICGDQPSSVINETVDKVLNELNTNFVETLLLSVSPSVDEEDDQSVSLKTLQPYWEAMEELVASDKVLSLGICDLNKESLEDLYNWAKVKPSIDQVNLESCCVMPQDLTEYAKSVNVQLLTHNDKPVFISRAKLQETILGVSTERDSELWSPQWVIRYSGILKCRGIITMKCYIFHAIKEKKNRIQ